MVQNWPIILASSLTGTVIAVAPDVDHVKEGDLVRMKRKKSGNAEKRKEQKEEN
jgi:hypothetical protein